MSRLPAAPLSPEAQQQLMGQLYLLMGSQVQSYHKQRHMGSSTSVSVELARELMTSMEYTVLLAGGFRPEERAEDVLRAGQALLTQKRDLARSLLALIRATAPQWQPRCRWEAMAYLERYLDGYDYMHLAHRGPDALFYPALTVPPEEVRGIDLCLYYLNVLWAENQIMDAFPEEAREALWDRLHTDTANPCEPLLLSAMAKTLLGKSPDPLLMEPGERAALSQVMEHATEESLSHAAERLCRSLGLRDTSAVSYVQAIVPQMLHWTGRHARSHGLENLFL